MALTFFSQKTLNPLQGYDSTHFTSLRTKRKKKNTPSTIISQHKENEREKQR